MSETRPGVLPDHLRARQTAERREFGVQVVAILMAVVCFSAAALFTDDMNEIRKERQLVIDPESTKGLPSDIALLGKLGTFRALAIDWASIRAGRLREEGKTYEALQLHETICVLAPRFPKVWADAAWNMAYNISVEQYSPEGRWTWVKNGIELLRDRGIQFNTRALLLYKELAYIYWHKIGDIMDDEHLNYRRALAVDMERTLGAPPVTVDDAGYIDWFREIVEAPRNLQGFIEGDVEVRHLVSALEAVDLAPDSSLLEFVARHDRPELRESDLIENRAALDADRAAGLAVVFDEDSAEALKRLLAAVRSKVLREKHKFDLDMMLRLMVEEYGPLDWRNNFAHALYWASRGDEMAKDYHGLDRADQLNTARLVFFSLQSLIDRGRMVLYPDFDDPFMSYLDLSPDTRYIPYLHDAYMRLGKRLHEDHEDYVEGTPGPKFMNGFVTAMQNWIFLLYFEGGERNLKLAENYYAWLREYNPHPDGTTQSRYMKTLDEFVMGDVLSQLQTYRAAGAIIRNLVTRGLKQYSLGQKRSAATSLARAQLCHDYWMQDSDADINDRMKLEPLDRIVRNQIIDFMKEPTFEPLFKARLWRELPLEYRQVTYDSLRQYFGELCESRSPVWSVSAAFPEPAGMNAARRRMQKTGGPSEPGADVEQGEKHKD